MIERIQKATASSPEGARGLVRGVLACAVQNVAFMLPTSLLYFLVRDLMAGTAGCRAAFYAGGCILCFALIFAATWFEYNGTYFTTYKESGVRRLALAERLRKLPLSFFGKRDLADLTSTIMADSEVLEKTCSHFIPGCSVRSSPRCSSPWGCSPLTGAWRWRHSGCSRYLLSLSDAQEKCRKA